MSADLPNTWSTSVSMARALASYIDDPHKVRRAVLDSFSSAPEIATIKRYRAEYLAPAPKEPPFKAHEGYYPGEVSRSAEETSRRFLWLLDQERLRSQRMREAA